MKSFRVTPYSIFLFIISTAWILLSSGCGTLFNVRVMSPESWLEGKDYTVQFSMANSEKAKKVTLYYRVNDGPFKAVEPQRNGSIREFIIPSAEMLPGRLDYYVIIIDADGKEHREGGRTVSILSRAEGKAQAERDLARRVQVSAPAEAAVTNDLVIGLSVSRPLGEVTATIHLRNVTSSLYRSVTLTPSEGTFIHRIAAADLREGELNYYFTVTEFNPEFGKLVISMPAEASGRPFVIRVIGLNELANRMAQELAAGLAHRPPAEALENADLPLSVSIRLPDTGLLRSRLLEPPSVLLHYGRIGTGRFRSVAMENDGRGTYTARIDRREIADGVDGYFFTVSVLTKDVGPLDISYPREGRRTPFVYRIVTREELRARRAAEYADKFFHTPPARASEIEPLELAVSFIPDAGDAARAPSLMRAALSYKLNPRDRFRELPMSRLGDSFTIALPLPRVPSGRIAYYFTVTLAFPDLGEVTIEVPGGGADRPFSVPIEDRNAAEARLKADLVKRTHHARLNEATAGTDVEVAVMIDAIKPGTRATLFVKQPGARQPLSIPMTARKNRLAAVIKGAVLVRGIHYYYIQIEEPHPIFRFISVVIPETAPERAWDFIVKSSPETPRPPVPPKPSEQPSPQPPEPPRPSPPPRPPVSPKPPETAPSLTLTAEDIIFEPVTSAQAGKTLKLRLQIKHPPEGLGVTLVWRLKNTRGGERKTSTSQSGDNFFAELDRSALVAGRVIEYYFIITLKDGAELRHPSADAPPFTLTVKGNRGGGEGQDEEEADGR